MSFNITKAYGTDPKLEIEGVWETLGEDSRIKIAKIGNKAYSKAYRNIPKGTRRMIENGTMGDVKVNEIVCSLLAETILLDWENVGIEEGKNLKYSYENAKKVLMDIPAFREFIWELASDFQTFHINAMEEDVKNS